jgi:hypothetical protein
MLFYYFYIYKYNLKSVPLCPTGFLAVLDASTLGEFRKYAIQWQLSPACRVAGFFGVLSSELSVFTLGKYRIFAHAPLFVFSQ